MAKYNGSGILLYADGVEIAAQKGFTLNANVNLFDITTKQSSGWAEHDKGVRSADVSFDALQSTTGLSNVELFAYITGRKSLMLTITALASVVVMEVDCSAMTINAPTEEAVGLSGSFKAKGRVFNLSAGTPNLITEMVNGDNIVYPPYESFSSTGIAVTEAINTAGAGEMRSNDFSMPIATYRLFTFLTYTIGQLPSVKAIINPGWADNTNTVQLVVGLNVVTLIASTASTCKLSIKSTADANYSLSNTYLMKV